MSKNKPHLELESIGYIMALQTFFFFYSPDDTNLPIQILNLKSFVQLLLKHNLVFF